MRQPFFLQHMGLYEQKQLAYKIEKILEKKEITSGRYTKLFQLNTLMGELLF